MRELKAGQSRERVGRVGLGRPEIQGFATDISVDQGQTVQFKIDSVTSLYRLDIYRMGWYGGQGARKVATVRPLTGTPQQPACLTRGATGLVDCGNWSVSASWAVPADAVSGIYFAKLVREDGRGGASHVVFVVRDDDGASELLFQTSDTTWQAYNQLRRQQPLHRCAGDQPGRAYKVSYNRPSPPAATRPRTGSSTPSTRWCAGWSATATTSATPPASTATAREPSCSSTRRSCRWATTSTGPAGQRANVEAARAAGVNLAFFSGNEVFWKTRWENSIDGPAPPTAPWSRYKETHANAKIDPHARRLDRHLARPALQPARRRRPARERPHRAAVHGQRRRHDRDPRPRGRRQDALLAQHQRRHARRRPDGHARPTARSATSGTRTPTTASAPPGSFRLSTTTVNGAPVLTDYGSTFGTGHGHPPPDPLPAPASGALVFGAGTVQWSWGLDDQPRPRQRRPRRAHATGHGQPARRHGRPARHPAGGAGRRRPRPATPRPQLHDHLSRRRAPAAGRPAGHITGTATDTGGGVVGGVEVSVDGGTTWHPASGRASWTYTWTPTGQRDVEHPQPRRRRQRQHARRRRAGVSGTVGPQATCPCSIWDSSATPANETDAERHERRSKLGVKFRPTWTGDHGPALLQGHHQHRHARRPPLVAQPARMLAEATFTQRDRSRLAAGAPLHPGERHRRHHLRRLLSRSGGPLRLEPQLLRRLGLRQRAAARARRRRGRRQRRVRLRPEPHLPEQHLSRATNYWVDVVFEQGSGAPTPPHRP